jgi:hypothetical protein
MALPTLTELFTEVESAKTKADKIAVLHKNNSPHLQLFLTYVFDSNVKWLLPEGCPPYKPVTDDVRLVRNRVWQDFRLFQHFNSTGPYSNLPANKRESMFVSFMETIDQDDAKLIVFIKDNRKLPFKSITRSLIAEAFPALVANWGEPIPEKVEVAKSKNASAPTGTTFELSLETFGNYGEESPVLDDITNKPVTPVGDINESKPVKTKKTRKPKTK